MQKSMYLLLVTLLIIGLAIPINAFNPKSVESMTVEITESGTLTPDTRIGEMLLTMYLPINYTNLEVNAESYEITQDSLGNNLIELKWTNVVSPIEYQVKTQVKSYAHYQTNANTKPAKDADSKYLKKGNGIEFTYFIKETAFPYKYSLEKIAELTEFTNNYIEYDASLVGNILNTSDILELKKGVCVEYATLLTSLLRTSGIATRFVSGYAYSDIDKDFIGHAWIEVLLEDGSWMPVDPTWMELGYLDAAHIKTANLLENKQTETLRYTSRAKNANIEWKKNQKPVVKILEKKENPVHELEADALQKEFAPEETGYVLATISGNGCSLISLKAVSCVNKQGQPMLNILNPNQVLWVCNEEKEVYWFFETDQNNYRCPITIFDQENSVSDIEITISGSKPAGHATITGPSTVSVNEEFTLGASIESGFFFYSSKLGKHPHTTWTLSMDKVGTYPFYLYSDGMLEQKDVIVVETKEFDITIIAPQNVTEFEEFPITLNIKNINHNASLATISIELEDRQMKDIITTEKGKSISLTYNITATEIGLQRLTASVYDTTISSYTTDVLVLEKKSVFSFFDPIIDFFTGIIDVIASLF